MKIRAGFVSNSSSSSFCLHGAKFSVGDKVKELEALGIEVDDDGNDDIAYYIEKLFAEDENISAIFEYEEEVITIGRLYSTLKDDETGGEFKAKTEKVLEKFKDFDLQFEFVEEVFYC